MISIFEKFSYTGYYSKGKYMPLNIRLPANVVFEKINKYLKDNNFENLKCDPRYRDCFGILNGFEYSFTIGQDIEHKAELNISVYGKHKRGRTRRRLFNILQEMKELFKDYL